MGRASSKRMIDVTASDVDDRDDSAVLDEETVLWHLEKVPYEQEEREGRVFVGILNGMVLGAALWSLMIAAWLLFV